jgi:ribonuclease T2
MQISKKYLFSILIVSSSLFLWTAPAFTQIAVNDSFTATTNCPAVQSIRKGSNAGNIRLTTNKTYPVVGKNKDNPSHYLLKIDGAQPAQRWVSKQCGKLLSAGATSNDNSPRNNLAGRKEYVLALSWQPSFCETKPNKTECQSQTSDRFDAKNLTLHGLWPNAGEYCGVSNKLVKIDRANNWDKLPPISLSLQTSQALAEKMPGFSSNLQLHEWYKHGTCYGTSPDQYFQDAMGLQDQVNGSKVQELFVNNIDKVIKNTAIRASFDDSFGTGTGQKVTVECKSDIDEDKAVMITELQISLAGEINNNSISDLITAGKLVKPGCLKGEVDRAGFN